MDSRKWNRLELRANRAFGLKVTPAYLAPDYDLVLNEPPVSSEEGHLELCRLVSRQSSRGTPYYSVRWDLAQNAVDVDRVLPGRYNKKIHDKNFQGHHSALISPGLYRIFVPNVFDGSVKLGIELILGLADSIQT